MGSEWREDFITNGALAPRELGWPLCSLGDGGPESGRAGIKSFVVEGNTPGVTIAKQEHKLSAFGPATQWPWHFDNARIPYENVLGDQEVRRVESRTGFQGR